MNEYVRQLCSEYIADAIALRREIHAHPEIGMECPETAGRICRILTEEGIFFRKAGSSAVIAEIKGTKAESDKIVMLRADTDALPVREKTGLPFASSVSGRMHACGHDLHTAMLVQAARILQRIRNEFAGTVRLLFQPGEEISQGAVYMIEHGCMDDVSMGFGIHVDPLLPAGVLAWKEGPDWAAVDHFRITVRGTGAHGAQPQKGCDALIAAASIALNLQTMVSRECDPMHPLVVTIGKMDAGTAYNIIADEAVLEGTCRSFDKDVRDLIPEALTRIAKQTASALKCTADVQLDRLAPPVINDETACAVLQEAAEEVLDASQLAQAKQEMIGEDFAQFGRYAPCVFAHLGADAGYPLHNAKINFKESCMETGILTEVQFVLTALEYLNR